MTLLAGFQRFGPGPLPGGWGPGRGHLLWPFAGLLFWALLAGLVVVLAVLLLKRRDERAAVAAAPSPAPAPASGASPLDVAEMRYARGELSREEFHALKADLQGLQDPRDATGPHEPQPPQG